MVQVTLNFETEQAAAEALMKLSASEVVAETHATPAPAPPAAAPAAAPAPPAAAPAAAPAPPAATPAPPAAAPAAASTEPVSKEQVQQEMQNVATAMGDQGAACFAIMKEYDCTGIAQLTAEQRIEVFAKVKAMA